MRWLAVLFALWAGAAQAVSCKDVSYETISYSICEVDATAERIELFLNNEAGEVIGQFSGVRAALSPKGKRLAFAMNAGMYHPDRAPVGLYIQDGKLIHRLITSKGPGNFGLLPNGVFCIRDKRADVMETRRYAREKPACRDATQSGPMLVIDGELHPRFLKDSDSRHIRNGVGTSADGRRVVFAISNQIVTFHEFGRFFRDYLHLPQALYLDGRVSRLYAPEIGRDDLGFALGPIVGVVE
jgi:uncharacterized protein YigE (DUF2233 family)